MFLDKPIPCEACGKSIFNGTVFLILAHENEDDRKYICSNCYYGAVPYSVVTAKGETHVFH